MPKPTPAGTGTRKSCRLSPATGAPKPAVGSPTNLVLSWMLHCGRLDAWTRGHRVCGESRASRTGRVHGPTLARAHRHTRRRPSKECQCVDTACTRPPRPRHWPHTHTDTPKDNRAVDDAVGSSHTTRHTPTRSTHGRTIYATVGPKHTYEICRGPKPKHPAVTGVSVCEQCQRQQCQSPAINL
jgi:hypothetical protein